MGQLSQEARVPRLSTELGLADHRALTLMPGRRLEKGPVRTTHARAQSLVRIRNETNYLICMCDCLAWRSFGPTSRL